MAISMRARAVAFGAAALFALAACGGDDDPLADRDPAPAPSGRPADPAQERTEIPAAATERTEAGAEAFVEYYFGTLVNETYSSGDVEALVQYSHPQCITCRATVGDIATAFSRGQIEGGQVSVRGTEATEATEDLTNVELTYTRTRYVEVDADGDNVFSSPANTGRDLLVQVQYSEGMDSWRVREIVPQDQVADPTPSPEPTG